MTAILNEGNEPLDVFVTNGVPGPVEVVEGALGVERVVERDAVDDEAERRELFFLALMVGSVSTITGNPHSRSWKFRGSVDDRR